jgi:hypothetical protein
VLKFPDWPLVLISPQLPPLEDELLDEELEDELNNGRGISPGRVVKAVLRIRCNSAP